MTGPTTQVDLTHAELLALLAGLESVAPAMHPQDAAALRRTLEHGKEHLEQGEDFT